MLFAKHRLNIAWVLTGFLYKVFNYTWVAYWALTHLSIVLLFCELFLVKEKQTVARRTPTETKGPEDVGQNNEH